MTRVTSVHETPRRAIFLETVEQVVPRRGLHFLIEPVSQGRQRLIGPSYAQTTNSFPATYRERSKSAHIFRAVARLSAERCSNYTRRRYGRRLFRADAQASHIGFVSQKPGGRIGEPPRACRRVSDVDASSGNGHTADGRLHGILSSRPEAMINLQVDDLDGVLDRLILEGVTVDPKRECYDFGRFGWFTDPEGNHVELWIGPQEFALSLQAARVSAAPHSTSRA